MIESSNSDNNKEAKKVALSHTIDAIQQLILQRFQTLTTISAVAFAVIGIILSSEVNLIKNETIAVISATILVLVAFISLGFHLYILRGDLYGLAKRMRDLPDQDWNVPFDEKEFKVDYWPETLFVFLVIGIVLFGLSLLNICV